MQVRLCRIVGIPDAGLSDETEPSLVHNCSLLALHIGAEVLPPGQAMGGMTGDLKQELAIAALVE